MVRTSPAPESCMNGFYPQNNAGVASNMQRTPNQAYPAAAAPRQDVYLRTEGAMRLEAQFAQYAQYNAQMQYPQQQEAYQPRALDIIYPRDEDIIYPARDRNVHDQPPQTSSSSSQYTENSRQLLNFEHDRPNYPNVLQHLPILQRNNGDHDDAGLKDHDFLDVGVKRKSESESPEAAMEERRCSAVESRKAWLEEMVCMYVCMRSCMCV